MKLLYFYTEFWDEQGNPKPFRGMDRIELNLSAEDRFRYDKSTDTLQRTLRNTPLPEDFWANEVAKTVGGPAPSKITNVNVIAGENGSGKSTVMQYVIDLLDAVYGALTHRDWKTEIRHDPRPNRSIVIMEDTSRNGGNPKSDDAEQQWYIFDYAPKGSRKKKINLSDDFLRNRTNAYRFSFCNWKHLSETQSPQGYRRGEAAEARNGIKQLLERTKLIYMTNTLTQRDHALDMSKESDSPLRDYFVYDCSLGAAIGSNAAQYFPYEVYKQVKYVFDRNQYRLRRSLEERIPALRIPRTLRLRPRIQALRPQSDSWMAEAFWDLLHPSGNEDMSDDSGLAGILGALCVAAYEKNMSRHVYRPYKPMKNNGQQFGIGEEDQGLKRLKESINAICSATGPILVTGTKNGELFVWESATGLYLYREQVYFGCVNSLSVLGDGSIAIGSKAGLFRLSNLLTNRRLQQLGRYLSNVYCTTGLPDGRVVCGTLDGSIHILDFSAGRHNKTVEIHSDCVNGIVCVPNGHIVTASDDRTLCVLKPDNDESLQRLEGHSGRVNCAVVLPDGRIASGSSAGEVYVWDLGTGQCLQWGDRRYGMVNCMAVLPDGRFISGSDDRTIRIWDPDRSDPITEGCLWMLEGHSSRITCVAVLADGRIVSGSDDRDVRIWDPNTGECLHRLKGHSSAVTCIHVLGDGRIASGSKDGYVRIWDPDSGACVQTLKGHSGQVNCIASVPNPFATSLRDLCLDYLDFLWAHREDLLAHFHRNRDGSAYELDLNRVVNGDSGDGLYALLAEFMEKYRYTCEPEYTVDFDWGLSSGEENMLRLFSNLYHVFDRDYNIKENGPYAIYNNEKHLPTRLLTTPCDTVLLFLDEADLTLHPEWQRTLIHILTAFLPRIYPAPMTKEMQIILSSHSPLLLGDIPGENVTYLMAGNQHDSEEKTWAPGETFGQNIHTLLKESFFLKEGTVGEFAAAKINAAAQRLQEIGDRRETTKPGEMEDLRKTVALTAPGILRASLEQLLRRAEQAIGYNQQQAEFEWLIDEINRLTPEAWDRLCQAERKRKAAMIKITPYYHRSKQECQEILTLYLKMVADVVPFLPKDVLDEVPESLKKTPRRRMEPYQKLLGDHKIPVEIKKSEQDALLARKLIESYSKKLHDFLYQGMPDDCCNVNRENLRQLLLIQLPSGELPAVMDFRPPDAGSEDEKKRKDLLLKYVFCYDKFCDHDEIYRFLELLGVSVCPYCNRQYITTVSTGSRRTRPQLDHFKNKSTYPFLALSINNLVPSCGICNLLKHDNDEAMLYPYEEEMGDRYRFRTVDKNGKFTSLRTGATRASHEFDVGLVCTGNKYEPTTVHARNSIENLALEKLYQSHKSYITSLYFQRYIHTDVFYEDMIRQFPSLFFPNYDPDSGTLTDDQINEIKEGLKRAMFLMDYRQDAWGDRPLAKLTHDIAMEIDKRSE